MAPGKDTARALRLRDNKRRHRARKKEYTESLEQKLRELQQNGVQATIEVQLSARKVAQENKRLRDLLRHVGVNEEIINSWVADHDGHLREMPKRPSSECLTCETRCRSSSNGLDSKKGECRIGGPQPASENGLDQVVTKSPPLISIVPQQANCMGCESPPEQIPSINTSSTPPCKLLTHLAANPRADITQMVTAPDAELQKCSKVDGGVPCSRAYRMLMHYATTESKLDYVAQVLEEGCVPHSDSSGGCSVKNTTIWQALDQLSCEEPAT